MPMGNYGDEMDKVLLVKTPKDSCIEFEISKEVNQNTKKTTSNPDLKKLLRQKRQK